MRERAERWMDRLDDADREIFGEAFLAFIYRWVIPVVLVAASVSAVASSLEHAPTRVVGVSAALTVAVLSYWKGTRMQRERRTPTD